MIEDDRYDFTPAGMTTITERPAVPNDPGYILQGKLENGALQLQTVLPGCRNPAPRRILNVMLDIKARVRLVEILLYGGGKV